MLINFYFIFTISSLIIEILDTMAQDISENGHYKTCCTCGYCV